jgi:hypothetical protein
MNRCRTFLTLCLTVMLFIPATVRVSLAAEDSVAIGRILGTIQPLSGFFKNNNTLVANNDYPEFLGFRFVNSQSGKKIKIRPRGSGYFSKSLGPGTWVLERHRNDRVSGDVPKEFKIMTFDVPEESLVNLGTIRIVLDGEPEETLFLRGGKDTGIYIYTYHYQRDEGADDFSWPVDNLKKKDSDVFEQYQNSIVEIKEPVTTEKDGSKYKVEVYDR